MTQFWREYVAELHQTLAAIDEEKIERLSELIVDARDHDHRIFLEGNGGSAAAASHWVCDFAKGMNHKGTKRLNIMSLTDCVPLLTAIGNDVSYDEIFAEPIQNYGKAGDLLITMSVSGSSPNLVCAHHVAKHLGMRTAALIGDYQGEIISYTDFVLIIPSKNYGVVEDIHLCLGHAISQKLKSI